MANTLKLILWTLLVNTIRVSANALCSIREDTPFTGGYRYYGDAGYYKFYSLSSTWGYAWKQCKEDGGHLVVIDSDEEYKIVQDVMNNSNRDVYIGAHDIFVEGWFVTVTGKCFLPSSYNKWRNGKPDDNGDCVVMNKNGEIRDEGCDETHYFICEVELK